MDGVFDITVRQRFASIVIAVGASETFVEVGLLSLSVDECGWCGPACGLDLVDVRGRGSGAICISSLEKCLMNTFWNLLLLYIRFVVRCVADATEYPVIRSVG